MNSSPTIAWMLFLTGTTLNIESFMGTIMCIGQPAEEKGGGAKAMLKDGLFTRFPKPDYALALHCSRPRVPPCQRHPT